VVVAGVATGVGAGVGAGTTGIGGVGGAVSVTTGAWARARPSALTAPVPGAAVVGVTAGGTSDMESVTTGIRWTWRRMITRRPPETRRTTLRPPVRVVVCVGTVRVAPIVRAPAERAGAAGVTFGRASAGKRATGSESSGIVTAATAGGFTAASIDAVIRLP
jgi:hypothetical protein